LTFFAINEIVMMGKTELFTIALSTFTPQVESAMVNNSVYPIITISFMAKNVKGSIEGKVIKEIKNE